MKGALPIKHHGAARGAVMGTAQGATPGPALGAVPCQRAATRLRSPHSASTEQGEGSEPWWKRGAEHGSLHLAVLWIFTG